MSVASAAAGSQPVYSFNYHLIDVVVFIDLLLWPQNIAFDQSTPWMVRNISLAFDNVLR